MATYIFSWDDFSTTAEARLKDFLIERYNIDWVKNAKIEKIDNGKTVQLSDKINSIFLTLNDNKTEATLVIDDGRIDKLKAAMKNDKLNIYKDITILCPSCKNNYLEDLENVIMCNKCGYRIERLNIQKSSGRLPTDNVTQPESISLECSNTGNWVTQGEFRIQILLDSILIILTLIIPLIFFYVIIFIIFYFILNDILSIQSFEKEEILAKLILYLTVSMGLLDLAALMSRQYLLPTANYIVNLVWHIKGKKPLPLKNNLPGEDELLEAEKIYITKVITFTIIFILSHMLYMLFKYEDIFDYKEIPMMVFVGLLGSAAVLVSIGLWNKFFLGSKRR